MRLLFTGILLFTCLPLFAAEARDSVESTPDYSMSHTMPGDSSSAVADEDRPELTATDYLIWPF